MSWGKTADPSARHLYCFTARGCMHAGPDRAAATPRLRKEIEKLWKLWLDVPAPVTSATLPCSEADARPRGPGTWSYLLVPAGAVEVTPGMVVRVVVSLTVVGSLLEEVELEEAGDW